MAHEVDDAAELAPPWDAPPLAGPLPIRCRSATSRRAFCVHLHVGGVSTITADRYDRSDGAYIFFGEHGEVVVSIQEDLVRRIDKQ
jgi:hypothetical protein